MIRTCRTLIVVKVTRRTRCRQPAKNTGRHVTRSARLIRMSVRQRKARCVLKHGSRPPNGCMTLHAIRREARCRMIRVCCRLEVVKVARGARRRQPRVHAGRRMTICTRAIRVAVAQREARRVLEVCTLPSRSVMTVEAVRTEPSSHVVGIRNALIVVKVTRSAVRRKA